MNPPNVTLADTLTRSFTILAFAAVLLTNASARAQEYYPAGPVCLRYSDSFATECHYVSLAQCQATAWGRNAYCMLNPSFFAATPEPYLRRPTWY